MAETETPATQMRASAVASCRRRAAASFSAVIRASRHLGFLVGLLIAAVAIGIAYRHLFDPLEERTAPFYLRSCVHAMGLSFSGWAVYLTFAAVPRSRLGGALRRLPLSAEFAIKALTMTVVLTITAIGLQFVLYPFPLSRHWLADELPRIVGITFTASLVVGAIFEFRRMIELAPSYTQEFDVVPRFRAGIHAGPVVVSECGVAKRQIPYFGDTMNVAARLCEYCKAAGEALIVSADMLRSAAIPYGLGVGRHASLMPRGRQTPVEAQAVYRNELAWADLGSPGSQ